MADRIISIAQETFAGCMSVACICLMLVQSLLILPCVLLHFGGVTFRYGTSSWTCAKTV